MISQKEVIDTLTTLVGFDTVSSHSNIALIDWIANRLDDLGVKAMVQRADESGKANLFATIGPADLPGVMLSGHSDVVPVIGETWQSDPFTLTKRGPNLYGRGSADMKAFIACFTALAPYFAKLPLKSPIHLALSYNEETNMHGMRQLAEHLKQAPIRPAACIIGEPTSMQIVVANKGAAIYRCHVTGKGVHSSLRDQGVSAVELAAELIVLLNGMQRQLNEAQRHDGFEFAHTSMHVGQIQGGTAHNITARECDFVFEIRTLPGVSASAIVADIRRHAQQMVQPLKARFPDVDICIDEMVDAPGLDEQGNRHLAETLRPYCSHGNFGRVSFGTEAGMLQQIGIQTVICGPGQIAVAHQADEFVEIEQIDQCSTFLQQIGQRLANAPWSVDAR